ncbi:MAG: hypothetical protein DME20_12385, partial [Verrucomicrobia bacterium]
MSNERAGDVIGATSREFMGGQKIFGRYTLVKVLGRGGMGIVWLARDEELERDVALKFLPDLMIQDRAAFDQLRHETKRCLELTHPHIVRIHDFVHDDRSGGISMEYIDGETLSNLRAEKEKRVFEADEIATWISQLCDALDYAHARANVIHCDLKPTNLMVNQRGDLKVTDFGIARSLSDSVSRLTLEQGRSGTLIYMSPQQLNGERCTHLDDIYSLGASIYELLTSKPPFYSGNIDRQICERVAPSMTERRKELDIEPAFVPQVWEDAVAACLAKGPSRRPQSAAEVAQRLELTPAQTRTRVAPGKRSNRKPLFIGGIAVLAVLALAGLYLGALKRQAKPTSRAVAIPEKSIAVLPFENRSEEKANAYFADGIQDEILTRLSKIAANTFDRKLTDIFSVESEVAKAIADQLRAKLTGREEQEIAAKPTDNPEAYDAYLRGLAYTLKTLPTSANALGAQKYFKEAVRLDPKFAISWAQLSIVDARNYLTQSLQPTVALCEEARHAAETALTLQPNLGEAVLAKGYYHYACLKDYDTAVRYFEQARQLLPNSSRISESLAYVARRRGQWDQSQAYFNEAERLDPRNVNLLSQQATNAICLRRFPEALRKFDEVLDITPDDLDILVQKAAIAQAEGDLLRASAILAALHPNADDTLAVETQVYQAILERRPAQMIPRLKEILAKPDPALGFYSGELRFWLGWAQEVAGDHAAAQETWRQARSELEPFLKKQPDNYSLIGDLALTNMGLGDKADALALSERAIAANPTERDAVIGPIPIEIGARVAAQVGEPDRAIAALQKLLSIPYAGALAENVPITPALLR